MSTSVSPELKTGAPSHLPIKTFVGHTDKVSSIAYFNNGTQIISGSWDKTVRIWDVGQGQESEISRLAHDLDVESIAMSFDGRTLVSGHHDMGQGQVVVWDLASKKVKWKTELNGELKGLCVALSPNGQLVAGTCQPHKLEETRRQADRVALLDAESGRRFREPLQVGEGVVCLVFSPDGTRLAVGSWEGKVRLFDVATGEIAVGPFSAHSSKASLLVFTPDGQRIITASSFDTSIRVWNSATGREVGKMMLERGDVIWQIALSPDGRRLASASSDRTVRVWDVQTRQQLGDPLQAERKTVLFSLAWSPDARSVVGGDYHGNISLWTVPSLVLGDSGDVTDPVPSASSLPEIMLPHTPRSRADSLSSSILNLPAGPSPTPPRSPSPDLNGEDANWEYSTNESFDSVLDLPADGSQPAQRRKRRRRRRVAPTAPPLPTPVVPDVVIAPPVVINPSHPPPPQIDQAPSLPEQTTPATDAPALRVGPLRRLWRQRRPLSRWTRRKSGKNREESRPMSGPSPTSNSIGTQHRAASLHSEVHSRPAGTPPTPTVLTRLRVLARSKPQRRSQTQNTTPDIENVEMHPPRGRSSSHTRRQSSFANVAAGRLDQRLAASSNKWTDKIDWLDYICFCMCCPWNKRASDSGSERRRGQRDVNAAGTGGSFGSSSSSSSELGGPDFNPNDIY